MNNEEKFYQIRKLILEYGFEMIKNAGKKLKDQDFSMPLKLASEKSYDILGLIDAHSIEDQGSFERGYEFGLKVGQKMKENELEPADTPDPNERLNMAEDELNKFAEGVNERIYALENEIKKIKQSNAENMQVVDGKISNLSNPFKTDYFKKFKTDLEKGLSVFSKKYVELKERICKAEQVERYNSDFISDVSQRLDFIERQIKNRPSRQSIQKMIQRNSIINSKKHDNSNS